MGSAKRPEHAVADALTIPDHQMLRRIGEGSYGEVWLARSATGALRAVKTVRRGDFDNEKPFEREFNGLLHFEPLSRGHEGLMDILQVGRSSSGDSFYCIMELADAALPLGEDGRSKMEEGTLQPPSNCQNQSPIPDPTTYAPLTLDVLIRQHGGRLPVKQCLVIASTLASALQYLHDAGLVHRDIKPSNIIFVGGVPKLADVGLVARTDSARTFVGTEGFLPPEGPGTPQADLYSLGKCLYEMAMGKDRQSFPSPPTLLDELPDRAELLELNEIISKACEPEAVRRYPSAQAMQTELELLRAGQSVQASRKAWRRQRWLTGIGVAAAVLLLGGGVAFYALSRPRLELVHTLEMPADWQPAAPLMGDWNRDGTTDLYLVGDKRFWVVSATGQVLVNHSFDIGGTVVGDLVADVNGDGAAELFLNWCEGTNLHLGVFNHLFAEVQHFRAEGAPPQGDSGGILLSRLMARSYADLKHDGHPAVIATRFTGWAKHPRDFCCFDYQTGDLRWLYPTAPCPGQVVPVDMDGDGMLDLLCGSAAVSNGYKLEDGTDDEHGYVYAISGDGKKLWTRELGDTSVGCFPFAMEIRGQKQKAIYASVSRHKLQYGDEVWSELGYIVRLDPRDGSVIRRYEVGTSINNSILASLSDGAEPRLLVADAQGFLHELDSDLNRVRKQQIVPRLYSYVTLRIAAVEDLDGDGRKELLFSSEQLKKLTEQSTRGKNGQPEPELALDNSLLVYSVNLKPLAKYVLRERSEIAVSSRPVVLSVPGQREKSIVVIYDHGEVPFLRYKRW